MDAVEVDTELYEDDYELFLYSIIVKVTKNNINGENGRNECDKF